MLRSRRVVIGGLAPLILGSVALGTAEAAPCVSGSVVLDSLTVAAGDTFCFDPGVSTTVTVQNGGNVIVNGVLQMRPVSASVVHVLRFTGVNEAGFAGGGDVPVATDPGLWVQGAGQLDIAGTHKVPWNRTGDDPSWTASDQLVSTPLAANDFTNFPTFVKGATVPSVTSPYGEVHRAEIINLTRNVRIEGTPTGRAHVHIKSSVPQTIKNAVIQHMGPRKDLDGDSHTDPFPGRSSLHFHRTGDGSRGSVVENVVVRDGGGERGYDIHASHGVTLRGVVAFNTNGTGIGWTSQESSHDTLIEDALAARQVPIPNFRGYGMAGIALPPGNGNVVRRSVAVGNLGNTTAAGVVWPETTGGLRLPGVWTAEDVVSHNNKTNGVYAWQNSSASHTVNSFVCFRNGKSGVEHGAYWTAYVYNDLTAWGNGQAGMIAHAASVVSPEGQTHDIVGGRIDGLKVVKHNADATMPVEFRNVDLTRPGGKKLVISELHDGGTKRGWYDFYSTGIEPGDVEVRPAPDGMVTGSTYRVKRADGTAFQINPDGSTTVITF